MNTTGIDNSGVKINFEISIKNYNRLKKYHPGYRLRHEIGRIALLEYINRKEGRDKKLQRENLMKDAGYIQEMIDTGLVKINSKE